MAVLFSISVVKCFQLGLPKIRKFQHFNCQNYSLNFHQVHLPIALDVLFCKDLMVNVGNSPVRTFTLFPKYVTFTPECGQLTLGNPLTFHM